VTSTPTRTIRRSTMRVEIVPALSQNHWATPDKPKPKPLDDFSMR
jgi:hypothetical protein